jgi:hypothetical protein
MAMNKVRRTSNINNIVTYDSLGNVTLPASLTIKGLTSAGFVKTDANGLLSVDITAYQPLLPSQAGNAGKFLTTNGSVVSWGTVSTINIYEYDGTLTGNRTVTMGSNTLSFSGDLLVNGVTVGRGNFNDNRNTAFGYLALSNAGNNGVLNTAIGSRAGAALGTGNIPYYSQNTFVGAEAGLSQTNGDSNTAIGSRALLGNISGSNNTAVGQGALQSNTANDNTAIGKDALASNTTGNSNVSIGKGALSLNLIGTNNTAIGIAALANNTASNNTAFGCNSLNANTTGTENVAVGMQSLLRSTTSNNTAIGFQSLLELTTGNNNNAFGYLSGRGITTGSNNTILGGNINNLPSTLSSHILIGDGAGNVRLAVNASGDFVIGGISPVPTFAGYKLDVNGTARVSTSITNNIAVFSGVEPNINITATGGTNSAALFLSPSAGYNGGIHNRTGGGLEFYTGATPSVAVTIGSNLNVGIGSAPNDINALQVGISNKFSGAFIGNLGGARTPSVNYGIHLGWNYSTSGESNIIWGSGGGAFPYLTFSSFDGTTKTDMFEIQNNGNIVFKNYTSATSFTGIPVGYLGFDANGNILTTTGGTITLSAIGSTPNANGATITGSVLNLEPASASFGGVVTTGTQTFAGAKTFNNNVGIAFTPSAWSTGYRALQIAAQGTGLFASTSLSQIGLTSNGYYDGTNWIYTNSSVAGQFIIDGNAHKWYTAATGSFGANITFTQAMTLGANGRLLIGTITDSGDFKLQVNGASYLNGNVSIGTTYSGFALNVSGTAYVIGGDLFLSDGYLVRNASNNSSIAFNTSALSFTGAATFSGNVTINGTDRVLELRGNAAAANSLLRFSDGTPTSKFSIGFNNSNFIVYDDVNSAYRLQIASTGAATFSGSVTSPQFTSTSQVAMLLNNSGANNDFRLGSASSVFRVVNAANTVALLSITDSGAATFSSELTSIGAGSLAVGQITDLLYVGDRTTVNTRYIKFIRASALTDIVQIQGMNGGVGTASFSLQAAGDNVLIGQTSDSGQKLQVNGSGKFSAAINYGMAYSFINTQTATNSTDTGDGVMSVSYNITGSSGTEAVVRAMSFSANNNMSGGFVTNMRGWNVASSTAAGSTTTDLDQIYIEKGGTSAGTVTNNRAIRINNMQGDNQAGLAFSGFNGTRNVYALFGTTVIPLGSWGVYQTQGSYNNYFAGKVVIGSTDTVGASPLNVKNLPTSASGLATGDVWNNGGVLNIV